MKLIVATYNNAKLREIKDILKGLNIRIVSLNYLEKKIKIKEDGKSYFENALKKAKTVSMFYPKDLIVGEDSGLEVYYLGKRPGIYSKRYAKNYNDYRNNLKIIKELEGVGCENRRARFFCCIALVKENKFLRKFTGELKGYISEKICGNFGFGYDPIFYLPKYKKTLAQLNLKEKNKISHRAKAFKKLKKYLFKFLKKN